VPTCRCRCGIRPGRRWGTLRVCAGAQCVAAVLPLMLDALCMSPRIPRSVTVFTAGAGRRAGLDLECGAKSPRIEIACRVADSRYSCRTCTGVCKARLHRCSNFAHLSASVAAMIMVLGRELGLSA
jgi:hypothetical protein